MNGTSAASGLVPQDIQTGLFDPFIAAVCATLREWASTEAVPRETSRGSQRQPLGDLVATLELNFPTQPGMLVLAFPRETAAALARRVLAEVTPEVDDNLIRDCLGELANVTAGQAKALLHGSAFRITFSTPRVHAAPHDIPPSGKDWLVAHLSCDLGEFSLQLCLTLD